MYLGEFNKHYKLFYIRMKMLTLKTTTPIRHQGSVEDLCVCVCVLVHATK